VKNIREDSGYSCIPTNITTAVIVVYPQIISKKGNMTFIVAPTLFKEHQPILLKDSLLPKMKFNDEDEEFSIESWESNSNDDIGELPNKLPYLSKQEDIRASYESNKSQDLYALPLVTEQSMEILITDNTPTIMEGLVTKHSMEILITDNTSNMMEGLVTKQSMETLIEDNNPTMMDRRKERNRIAARKCRQKQKDRVDVLEQDVREISNVNYQVENEIRSLQIQLQELKHVLVNHACVMRAPVLASNKYLMNF